VTARYGPSILLVTSRDTASGIQSTLFKGHSQVVVTEGLGLS
jgi:hypothetical protein